MKKDTVYIDTEDDITAIIGKIKTGKEKVVALVPPKRVGVLQSAVNLRLLQRAAKQSKKHLVLVTNDAALRSLAASEEIPVAKTLQSKPEIPEIATLDVDSGSDIIDGASLPVGDHARAAGEDNPVIADEEATQAIGAAAVTSAKDNKPSKGKKVAKVPNFNRTRKKIILFSILGVLLIGFLVWAIKFAPRATITIESKTVEESLNLDVSLKANAKPDLKEATLPIEKREVSDDVSINLTPTGTRNVGKKAKGVVLIKGDAAEILVNGVTVPSGTTVRSSGGSEYTTDSEVSLTTASDYTNGVIVGVTAKDRGEKYNGASGSASMNVTGVTSVKFDEETSGGTDKEVKVLTAGDVSRANEEVDKSLRDKEKRGDLAKQFGDDYVVLDGTFNGARDGVKPSPAVGEEVKGEAKLSGKITYTLYAVPKDELTKLLDEHFKAEIKEEPNQRIYDNGIDEARFMTLTGEGSSWQATLVATAEIGPDVKDDQVKEVAKGKKYDEIRSTLESINGVETADTKFWPFWVNKAPNDSNRITVVFSVDGKE